MLIFKRRLLNHPVEDKNHEIILLIHTGPLTEQPKVFYRNYPIKFHDNSVKSGIT